MNLCQDKKPDGVSSSIFIEALISENRLDDFGFSRLVFAPGMLFDSPETWWPGGGVRPATHEGIDLCVFETTDGTFGRLDETVRVPMAFDGEIVGHCKDFLGRTVIARHHIPAVAPSVVYGMYAHILPDAHLGVGDILPAGHPVGRIAPVASGKAPLPPHLHLTFARADLLPPVDQLNWPTLNRISRSFFCDPLELLQLPYRYSPDSLGPVDPKSCAAVERFRKSRPVHR